MAEAAVFPADPSASITPTNAFFDLSASGSVPYANPTSHLIPALPSNNPLHSRRSKSKRNLWVSTRTANGTLFWRSGLSPVRPAPSARLPIPPIRARPRRPHAIHIIAYPPGFVPYDLRPVIRLRPSVSDQAGGLDAELDSAVPTRQLQVATVEQSDWLLSSRRRATRPSRREAELVALRPPGTLNFRRSTSLRQTSAWADFGKIFSAPFHHRRGSGSKILPHSSSTPSPPYSVAISPSEPRAHDFTMIRPALSTKLVTASVVKERSKPIATGSGVTCSILLAEPTVFLFGFDHDGRRSRHESPAGTALLRGTLCLNVTKNVKIKVIQLKLVGRARTEWAEGVPPLKQETFEEDVLRTQVLTFFNALNDGWETDYGSQCYFAPQNPPPSPSPYPSPSSSSMPSLPSSLSLSSSLRRPPNAVSASTKALHRSSLALAPLAASLSIGRDDLIATSTQLKGHRIFYPGTYNYSFELPIDHHQLETIKLPSGSVRWELQATIDRAGAFKANLHGAREVLVVRVPDQLSLETSEPISISRQWEDQLHYDIVVSGKSFPIGSRIPVAFRLTPLAKVRVHKIKMYVSETVEYWTSDRRVARREPGRKILLLEKTAGRPLDPAFAGSELCVLSGGETSRAERRESNRDVATLARASTSLAPLGEHTDNLLGDLDLGLEEFWGATEMEANVQLPTCVMMAKNKELRLSPDCSWKNVNVFHWIKIVLRLSRLDPDDPTGVRRRHFEISIDSPFTVLDCRATQTNLNLPQYAGADPPEPNACRRSCGCADAPYVGRGDTAVSSTYLLSSSAAIGAIHGDEPSTLTPGSYIDSRNSVAGAMSRPLRPIHLLRKPSYNPPPFDADLSPPRLSLDLSTDIFSQSTPPPNYDTVVGTPSVDGMADYFTRLALYENHNPPEDDDEGVEDHVGGAKILTILTDRGGRVNVANPRTPGSNSTNGARSAPSRSFDIARPALDLTMR